VIERPQLPTLALRSADFAPKSTRPVYFDAEFRDTPVFERASLPAGGRVDGPAVVEEFGSTTVIFPHQYLEVDPHGILVIRPVLLQEAQR
jgi:N-methylhydantoinase A